MYQLPALIALTEIPNLGPKGIIKLHKIEKSLEKLFTLNITQLEKLGIPKNLAEKIYNKSKNVDLKTLSDIYSTQNIQLIPYWSKEYPKLLLQIPDFPPLLFVKGRVLPQDNKSIGVVGTRRVTSYGKLVTEQLVTDLLDEGFTIVSGLARGVDGIAHQVALQKKGRTIAVLGSGLDYIYPPEHKGLAQKITQNGALISEYPLGTKPFQANFPARNRIIAGLSLGVVVTEAIIKSGTQITASWAADYGREVFAVPGNIESQYSKGPHLLIKQGAKLTENIDDILEELKIKRKIRNLFRQDSSIDGYEKILLEMLDSGPTHFDILAQKTELNAKDLGVLITKLEISGRIKNIGSNTFVKLK